VVFIQMCCGCSNRPGHFARECTADDSGRGMGGGGRGRNGSYRGANEGISGY